MNESEQCQPYCEVDLAPADMGTDVLLARIRKLLMQYPQLNTHEKNEYDALMNEISNRDLGEFLPILQLY